MVTGNGARWPEPTSEGAGPVSRGPVGPRFRGRRSRRFGKSFSAAGHAVTRILGTSTAAGPPRGAEHAAQDLGHPVQRRRGGTGRPSSHRRHRPHQQCELRKNYVTTQLSQQNITFKTADTLTDEERKSACLVKYAGQKLTTGKQAECYANDFIGLHVQSIAGGKTYADLGTPQSQLQAKVTQAQKNNDPNTADLQKQLNALTAQRETLFKGETLRGLLLTSYGFSVFGDKAGQAALVSYLAALLLALLSIAGFAHALITPKSRTFAAAEPDTAAVDRSPSRA